jgi:hypothetical protein
MAPAGRPKLGKEKKRRVNLMLEPATYEYLRQVGQGSASTGIALIVLRHTAESLHDAVQKLPKRRKAK